MSIIPGIDESRLCDGMTEDDYNLHRSSSLMPLPILGAENVAGAVAVVSLHSEEGGMTYEMAEPHEGRWHRHASGPKPYKVRPS
jgi:hypothetical protein